MRFCDPTSECVPTSLIDALNSAIPLGERLCAESPELEGPDFEAAALQCGFTNGGDPARVLNAVTLYRGLSPVYGWCGDERRVLRALGAAATSVASHPTVVVAAASRIWRLRGDTPGRSVGKRVASSKTIATNGPCRHIAAFLSGAALHLADDALHAFRQLTDRQIGAAPGRERVGTWWAARVPLTSLIELGAARAEDVAAAFPEDDKARTAIGAQLDARKVRRMLKAAKRSRGSRVRDARDTT